jgi:hypothetical protein
MDEKEKGEAIPDDGLAEIEAMRSVAGALKNLDPLARDRVLRWTSEKYGVQLQRAVASPLPRAEQRRTDSLRSDISEGGDGSSDLAELYASCQPRTDADKTLVVSFWLQETGGVSGVDAQSVNTQLKHLGHGVGNITRAFDRLMQNRPQLMIQTKKAGSTKQARKIYRVTLEGRNMIEQLRQGGGGVA